MRSLKEALKKIAYQSPVFTTWSAPKYPYNINPSQLTFLCDGITKTKDSVGSILEIGVARGNTSVFLLEHLRTTSDPRRIYFLDTFSGFTEDSIRHETQVRGKSANEYDAFRYGDEQIFIRNLKRLGHTNFETIKGDASKVDYSQFAPIDVALLDIDLYKPTKAVLERLWDHMATPSFICVDDCQAGTPWDGSLQAYKEFISQKNLPFTIVGERGGIILKGGPKH